MNNESLIEMLELLPHPEGGFYKETYRSSGSIDGLNRSFSTGIYFLLRQGDVSKFHRIKSDEMWHFYSGGPLRIIEINEEGGLVETILGLDFEKGMVPQYVVKANRWFGSLPLEGSDYSFVGCTVAPGFDFADFEMAKKEDLLNQFPALSQEIELLC